MCGKLKPMTEGETGKQHCTLTTILEPFLKKAQKNGHTNTEHSSCLFKSKNGQSLSHTHFCHLRVASSSVECKITTSAGTVITSSIFLQKIFYRCCRGSLLLVNIGRTDREQIRSRINNNDCRTFRPRRPLSTAYKTYKVLYAVDKGLRGRNVLQSLLLILLRICSRSVHPIIHFPTEDLLQNKTD